MIQKDVLNSFHNKTVDLEYTKKNTFKISHQKYSHSDYQIKLFFEYQIIIYVYRLFRCKTS